MPFMGAPGWPELIIIMVIVLLLFGKRLPGAMKSLGQSIGAFKEGVKDGEAEPIESDKENDDAREKSDI